MRLCFLTSTPMNPFLGSGTFAGIRALRQGLLRLGLHVDLLTPLSYWPNYTLRRILFNTSLARQLSSLAPDVIVGFDMDGYQLPPWPFVASIKGVIADELLNERGLTRLSMRLQAACERRSVHRASCVLAPSRYSAARIQEHYGYPAARVRIVPEAIDFAGWRDLFVRNPAPPSGRFTVLSVSRFYPRKRLDVLLRAATLLGDIEIRIAGDGPERRALLKLHGELALGSRVLWLGQLSQSDLAAEYNRCDVFCLPSVQEAFGIVFLEAMAAGKPIVASRAAVVPEVVRDGLDGLLVPPRDPEALAAALARLRDHAGLRRTLASNGPARAAQFDLDKVAARFLDCLRDLLR